MASLIPGYEYDIFISYRQKDNKGDKWVSKFVESLKTELEATFKEDVSVYFDENPHDRLQETHNVDKSLEGKLKCLILIPILSQTYCDPNSYAWQYEFLAFLKMAENDPLGKDVRLRGGNVASRILPVRIHDLEQEDVKLFEKETGSVLRAMDFVFKTASGVNRPLKVNEDHPQDNLNKTFYTDQINKMAHAIKEIISGLKTGPVELVKEKIKQQEPLEEVKREERNEVPEKPAKTSRQKFLSGIAILAILIIAAVLVYPKIFKRNTLEKLRSSGERISVAVMPFQNMTNDTTWNVWQDGIQNELINYLTNSEDLKVRQTESINNLIQSKGLANYALLTPTIASNISQKLDANVFIYGSIKQIGTTIRVNAQLIDSKTKEAFKAFQIDGKTENILDITDSLSRLVNNFLIINILEKQIPQEFQHYGYTNSPEAYRNYINGLNAFAKYDYPTARNWLLKAIAIDSNFTLATMQIAFAYGNQQIYDQARKWCLKYYRKEDQLSPQWKIMADFAYATYFETPYEEIRCLKQYFELDDHSASFHWQLGDSYRKLAQWDKAIPEFEKALELFSKQDLKPFWVFEYTFLGLAYHETHQFKKENKLYRKAEQDFPDDPLLIFRQAVLTLSEAKTKDANDYIEKYKSLLEERSTTEVNITTNLASIYAEAGVLDKAEGYYRKALSIEPDNPARLDNLGYFLINRDRNINEGLDFVDKALKLRPDFYSYLHHKGWALYKLGKYQEAFEMLQKSWDLRRQNAIYNHEAFLHLDSAKKAVASLR
jgi:TolB-like protein/Tfp pilus assembly protein PilF